MMNSSKPLDKFPLARTTDPDVVRAALARVYAAPVLQLRRGTKALNARLNERRLQNVTLAYGCYGGAVTLDFPAVNCFVHLLPFSGGAEITCRGQSWSAAANGATISPEAGYRASYSADYQGILLKLDTAAVTRKLAAMTGATVNQPLRISLQPNRTQSAQLLRRYLPLLVDMLGDATSPLPPWWVAQTEQLLMAMFLCGHRHNYSHLLEQEALDSAPWQVRRAEDYIEAHCHEPITLENLAEITGVSAFSLFRCFRRTRGYSPFDFAYQARLRRGLGYR